MPTFTDDWVKKAEDHRENWDDWTRGFGQNSALQILEVGSFEGRSVLQWLSMFPEATVTCVDPFGGTAHGDDYGATFDANLEGLKVIKRIGLSKDVLPTLKGSYDIIYIDGDHTAAAAQLDGELAWPLLRHGGVLIFDDYGFDFPDMRPSVGIEAFLASIKGEFVEIGRCWQLAIKKK